MFSGPALRRALEKAQVRWTGKEVNDPSFEDMACGIYELTEAPDVRFASCFRSKGDDAVLGKIDEVHRSLRCAMSTLFQRRYGADDGERIYKTWLALCDKIDEREFRCVELKKLTNLVGIFNAQNRYNQEVEATHLMAVKVELITQITIDIKERQDNFDNMLSSVQVANCEPAPKRFRSEQFVP